MKAKFTWVGIIATFLVILTTFFVGCKKDDMNDVIVYHGQVVYINTTTPFPDLTVKVTNGNDTHCQTQTDAGGTFSLKVRVNEIDGSYYLLVDGSSCAPKKVGLGGYGQASVDLGIIEVEGPSMAIVKTSTITNIRAQSALGGGTVISSVGSAVTKRGVCWSTSQYPTIANDHTEDGTGIGEFISNIRNLQSNTTYYVRAYATNNNGTAYGNQETFTTEGGVLPKVRTALVRVENKTTVYYEGLVIDEGDSPVTARGICWGTSTPNINNSKTTNGEGNGSFSGSTSVSNVHSQNLYFRAYATNGSGTAYGEAVMIDHYNPYQLPTISDGNITWIVLPYDLEGRYSAGYFENNSSVYTFAVNTCNELYAYDYLDWEVPTLSVLKLMYEHKTEIGGFLNEKYWSNTPNGDMYYYVDFKNGSSSYNDRRLAYFVRPVRKYSVPLTKTKNIISKFVGKRRR